MGHHSSKGNGSGRRNGQLKVGAIGASLLLGLLGSGAFVWQSTTSAFTAATTNGVNSWSVGSVTLADDDATNAMFALTNQKPGDTTTKCINVNYTGTLAGNIRLFPSTVTDASPAVAPYVKLIIDEGSAAAGGATGSCTGFTGASNVYTGTLDDMKTTKGTWATGVNWTVAGAANKSYRIQYTLDTLTPDDRQGKSVSATFTWEARNS